MKITRLVNMPCDLSEEFEVFLYSVLQYKEFGYSRQASGNENIYMLNLDENESMMILLKYLGSSIKTL